MRKLVIAMTAVALGLSMAACKPREEAANEAVPEEPMANEANNMDVGTDLNATDMGTDLNASENMTDGNAAE